MLKKDLCTYYGYNDFMVEYVLNLFPVAEALEVTGQPAPCCDRSIDAADGLWKSIGAVGADDRSHTDADDGSHSEADN